MAEWTTKDVAQRRGCHQSTVSRVAGKHAVGRRVGQTGIRLFTAAEVRRLCALIHDRPGRPKQKK